MLAGVDIKAVTRAEQNDLVGDRDIGNSGDVCQSEVHRDAADDWGVVVTNDDAPTIREASVQSIRIAHWQNGNAGGRLGDVNPAISQRLSGTHVTQRKNASFPDKRRLH